jgi:hypothetical protein
MSNIRMRRNRNEFRCFIAESLKHHTWWGGCVDTWRARARAPARATSHTSMPTIPQAHLAKAYITNIHIISNNTFYDKVYFNTGCPKYPDTWRQRRLSMKGCFRQPSNNFRARTLELMNLTIARVNKVTPLME